MSTSPSVEYRNSSIPQNNLIVLPLPQQEQLIKTPVKFDAAFIERRMRQHREWQKSEEWKLTVAVVREVLFLDAIAGAAEEIAAQKEPTSNDFLD